MNFNYDISSKRTAIYIIFCLLFSIILSKAIIDSDILYFGFSLIPFLIWIAIEKPYIFPFGLYIFLLPFDNILSITGSFHGTTLTMLLGGLSIFTLLVKGGLENRFSFPPSNIFYLLAINIFALFSLYWAYDQHYIIQRIQTFSSLVLLYIILSTYIFMRTEYIIIKQCIFLSGLAAAFLIIVLFFSGIFIEGTERVSVSTGGRLVDPNAIIFNMLLAVSICIQMIINQRNYFIRIFYIFSLSALLFAVVLSGSRGGTVGIMTIIVVYMLFIRTKSKLSFICYTCIVIIFVLAFTPDIYYNRLMLTMEDKGGGRLEIWYVGFQALKKYWFLGAGLGNFPVAYTEFAFSYAPAHLKYSHVAHNLFLGAAVELGVIGFSLFCLFLVSNFKLLSIHADRHDSDRIMLKSSFLGMIVSSFFLDTMYLKSFWLTLSLIAIYHNVVRVEIENWN